MAMRNFHLPWPEPLYERLREAADRARQPATSLARYAIDAWLREHRKAMVREAIAEYAARIAGTADDLDETLEEASLEHLAAPAGPTGGEDVRRTQRAVRRAAAPRDAGRPAASSKPRRRPRRSRSTGKRTG